MHLVKQLVVFHMVHCTITLPLSETVLPESKGAVHLINLTAFEVKAIYHEKHRIKCAFKET